MLSFNTNDHEFVLTDSLCTGMEDKIVQYKGFLYSISNEGRKISYIGPVNNDSKAETITGALYYGFSYIYELKNKMMEM